jgi:hypothetical protein
VNRLAKSSHVVLREASQLLASYGAPRYLTDRMAILAEVSRENREEASRLIKAVYNGIEEEAALLGEGNPIEGIRP